MSMTGNGDDKPRDYEQTLGAYLRYQYQNCWCRKCDRSVNMLPMVMCVCPACGDKRCPRAEHHDNECAKAKETQ